MSYNRRCDSSLRLCKVPVLMLAMSLDIGGAETHIVGLAKALSEMGWPVHVASRGGRRVADLEKAGIPHHVAPLNSRRPTDLIAGARAISHLVDCLGVGLVHAHARIPAFLANKICRNKGIPLVTTYHYTFVAGFPWNIFTRPGDLTIAVSEDVREYIAEKFGFNKDRIVVIPNGIDTDLYAPVSEEAKQLHRASFGVPPDAGPVVLYASRLNRELSETAVIAARAVTILLDRFPKAVLLIAGDGDGLETVRAEGRKLNRSLGRDVVRCLGFVLDTPPLYSASDVVVGMSRVALEAMACEKPVVIAGPGGIFGPVRHEMVETLEERNYTSRGAPFPCTPEGLASELSQLLSDERRARELGKFGRQIVLRNHSMDLVAREVEAVYLQALSRGQKGREENT